MTEDLIFLKEWTKRKKYEYIFPQIESLLCGESNLIANCANISAVLKERMDFFWVGFYFVDSKDELVLGPFQGSVACKRIKKGKGVCGLSWEKGQVLIVPDVDKFSDHIVCSSVSKSEIVLPVKKNGEIIGVLDVDSDVINDFDETDKKYLQKILSLIP